MSNLRYSLDSHKLVYHPERVAEFLDKRDIRPLYAEISPTAQCNHRCLFCNFNYLGHNGIFPRGRMPSLARELVAAGVKAIVFAGAGEPTLHPDTFPAIMAARHAGADVAMSTNGALLTPEMLSVMAQELTWVRFSISGGTAESHQRVHRGRPNDFTQTLANIAALRNERDMKGTPLTIGSQCVLIPENHADVHNLARVLKANGADYFVIKHFYTHDANAFMPDMTFRTPAYLEQLDAMARELSSDGFSCIVRSHEKLDRTRPYTTCHGLPFILYVREDGELYSCFSHQEDPQTSLGNVSETPFAAVWASPQKQTAFDHIARSIDKNRCQANCRHHQVNLWLHELSTPPAHINFI